MTRQPKTQRVAVRLPADAPSGQWARSIRLSGFAITTLSLIVLCVVVLAPSLHILIQQRQQIAALQAQVEESKKAVNDLKEEQARWSDSNYIESLARERLNYVFPGDYSYLVIDDGKTPTTPDGQPISDQIQTTQVDWVDSLLSSVFTAGLTDKPTDKIVAPVIKGAQ